MSKLFKAIADYLKQAFATKKHIVKPIGAKPIVTNPEVSKTPWIEWMLKMEGWSEFTHDKQLTKYWVHTSYKSDTVIGKESAWCAMILNAALAETGYAGNYSARAKDAKNIGNACDLVPGCVVVIKHTSGSFHVAFFVGWENESKRLAKLLGGNQGNKLCVNVYNITGNVNGHDEIYATRWPVKKP